MFPEHMRVFLLATPSSLLFEGVHWVWKGVCVFQFSVHSDPACCSFWFILILSSDDKKPLSQWNIYFWNASQTQPYRLHLGVRKLQTFKRHNFTSLRSAYLQTNILLKGEEKAPLVTIISGRHPRRVANLFFINAKDEFFKRAELCIYFHCASVVSSFSPWLSYTISKTFTVCFMW